MNIMTDGIEEKSSISRVQKSTGTYRFRIEGFSGLSTRVGDSVESPEFQLCGYTWQLRIFPGGSLDVHKGYVSYYLASKSNRMARASYKLSIVNQIIGGEDETFASSGIRIFEAKGVQVDGWGRDKFMVAAMMKDPDFGFWLDDAVVFKVEITAYGELEAFATNGGRDTIVTKFSKHACLTNALRAVFDDHVTSDLVVIVGSKQDKLYVHKCILAARSDVFYAMLTMPMRESTKGELVIQDFEPAVVKEMMHFLYTDFPPEKSFLQDNGVALLTIAIKYQIPGLINTCEDYYTSTLQVEAAVATLQLAEQIGAVGLKQKTMHFIAQHSSRILQMKEFHDLEEDLLKETNSIIEVVNKRKGCRGSLEKERRFTFGCQIM